jgi:hypothetical protein
MQCGGDHTAILLVTVAVHATTKTRCTRKLTSSGLIPLSGVSIGLCLNGQPQIGEGVVFSPMTNKLYSQCAIMDNFETKVVCCDIRVKRPVHYFDHAVVCFEFGLFFECNQTFAGTWSTNSTRLRQWSFRSLLCFM